MTVKQLKRFLSKLPDDMEVYKQELPYGLDWREHDFGLDKINLKEFDIDLEKNKLIIM